MNKVLITGGAGFIGHHLINEILVTDTETIVYLVDDLSNNVVNPVEYFANFKVREILPQMIDFYDNTTDTRKPRVVIVNSDFSHPNIISLINDGMFKTVFHLAAKPRVEWSVENPIESTNENFTKVLNIAMACAKSETRLVFSSTAAVYGNSDKLPVWENDTSAVPTSPYGLSKLCVEKYLALFEDLFGLDWVALRYFNVYGPAQPGDSAYSTVVSAWCHKAGENKPLRSDGDGTQTRDMIYVHDVVTANICVSKEKKLYNRVFNVGTETSVSNNDILKFFTDKGYTNVTTAPERKGDVKHTLAQTALLKALGWRPKTTFAAGIKEVFNYWEL